MSVSIKGHLDGAKHSSSTTEACTVPGSCAWLDAPLKYTNGKSVRDHVPVASLVKWLWESEEVYGSENKHPSAEENAVGVKCVKLVCYCKS